MTKWTYITFCCLLLLLTSGVTSIFTLYADDSFVDPAIPVSSAGSRLVVLGDISPEGVATSTTVSLDTAVQLLLEKNQNDLILLQLKQQTLILSKIYEKMK